MAKEKMETKIIDANTEEITYQTEDRIVTIDDLIKATKVDLDIWEILNFSCNKWEAFTVSESGEPQPFPLFQVKFTTKRKNLIANFPVVQPIEINIEAMTYAELPKRELEKALVLSDLHVGFRRNLETNALQPFHDRKAIALAISMAKDTQPNLIIINGDVLDLSMFSDKFLREPEFYFTTQPALIEANWILGQLRLACPNSKIVLLAGNHDDRLRKSLITHYLEAYSLKTVGDEQEIPVLSLQKLLNLDKLGVECVENQSTGYWINENLLAKHGDKARSENGATTREFLKDIRCSVLVGHIHRIESIYKTVQGKDIRKTYSATSLGCLCRIDGFVPGSEHGCNWSQGLGFVDYEPGNGFFSISPVSIYDGQAVYNGKIYRGVNYRNSLQKDTKKNF